MPLLTLPTEFIPKEEKVGGISIVYGLKNATVGLQHEHEVIVDTLGYVTVSQNVSDIVSKGHIKYCIGYELDKINEE